MKRHIALIGFMASGKSTVGRHLARKLKCAFYDSDVFVRKAHGPIGEIFSEEGERTFRRYEHEAIARILKESPPGVLAVGGGAPTHEPTRELLATFTYRVFIKVAPEVALERVRRSSIVRPMAGAKPAIAHVRKLYEQRMPAYSHADFTLEVEEMSAAQAADAIATWIRKRKIPL